MSAAVYYKVLNLTVNFIFAYVGVENIVNKILQTNLLSKDSVRRIGG